MSEIFAIVSQFMTRNHGQGKINLELMVRLLERGHRLRAISSWLEDEVAAHPNVDWDRIAVSSAVPTNWLRCEAFRYQSQLCIGKEQTVAINNGAAAVAPSIVNIAMFVHSAWRHSRWRQSAWTGVQPALQWAFTTHQSKLEIRAFKMARWVVALSNLGKGELIEFCNVREDQVKVIPPGVDADLFRPLAPCQKNALREACGLSAKDDRLLVLFVGEIRSSRKNLDLVLKLLTVESDLLLAVVGSEKGSRYPKLAQELKVDDRVFFLGQRENVPELMPGADIFVFPTHYEPYGLVVTEAMACGIPVVVTRQAGAAGSVSQGQEGWLLEDGSDIDGLVWAISQARNAENRQMISKRARVRAESLTWECMADSYEALLVDAT